MTTAAGTSRPTPYRDTARTYRGAGWVGILPIPYRTKKLLLRGWTGHAGAWPSSADVQAWMDSDRHDEGGGNVALRLPPDVVGIDVDAYTGKTGGSTLAEAMHRWGEIPDTWVSTARDDQVSGIRLYRVPEGLRWPGQVGPGIETIHTGHRYAMVWPSVHPEGRMYRWYRPDGIASTVPPNVDELPELPDRWLVGLTGGEMAEPVHAADLTDTQTREWLARHARPVTCRAMATIRDRMLLEMPTGAHESLRRLMGLVRFAEQGHHGLLEAIGVVRDAFLVDATNQARSGQPRTQTEAEGEWRRSLTGAVRRVLGTPSVAEGEAPDDPCTEPFAGLIAPTGAAPSADGDAIRGTGPQLPSAAPTESDGHVPADPSMAEQVHARMVAAEMANLRVRRDARRQLDDEEARAAFRVPVWRATLTDELAIPDEPVVYTVDQVMPAGANVLLTAQYKAGKAVDAAEPILTQFGWSTMGALREGDRVHAPDGSLVEVSFASLIMLNRECYRVKFADGRSVVVDSEHLWTVRDIPHSRNVTLTTAQIRDTYIRWVSNAYTGYRYAIDLAEPLHRAEVDLPVDPYLLGVWLGDGSSADGCVTTPDPEIEQAFVSGGYVGLRTQLRQLKVLGNKHVPEMYLLGSPTQRAALLAGLLYSDGCVTGAPPQTPRIEFTSTTAELADAVLFLARSLGWRARAHEGRAKLRGQDCGPKYRVSWTAYADESPFRLVRQTKRLGCRPSSIQRSRSVSVTGVVPVESRPVRCIQVDHPSCLYLVGRGLVPTHNTTVVNSLARALADKEPWLGRFDVAALPGRIALWNYEVDERQYRRWLRDLDIANPDVITPLNLRGYRLPLVSRWVEDWVVRWLADHEIGVWVVDPFARAFVGSGVSENDNTEVGRFLDTLDVIKSRAGVSDLVMPTHTGRGEMEEGQERARGATRLDDWADVRWLLTKDRDDARYFRATGRDVEVPESALAFDPTSRMLSLRSGGRKQGRRGRVQSAIVKAVSERPGIGVRDLRMRVRADLGTCGNEVFDEAYRELLESGRLRTEQDHRSNRPSRHFVADPSDLVGDDS